MKKILFLLFLFNQFSGSAQYLEISKLTISNYDDKIQSDPSVNYSKFKTFSISSYNQIINQAKPTLEEKLFEFFAINMIDYSMGYKYIPDSDTTKPDLLIVYNYSNDFKEKFIPPQTIIIPTWNPGTSSSTINNSNQTSTGNITGDVNLNANIQSNNTTFSKTTTEGKWSTTQIQRPGYTQGMYYPNFQFSVYSFQDGNKVWQGEATCTTQEDNLIYSAQCLMTSLILKIPQGSYDDSSVLINNNGYLGIKFISYTTDGINFFPMIINVEPSSPATKSSLKQFDTIIEINNVSTSNKSGFEIRRMFEGNAGTKINIKIYRNSRILSKSITKELRK